MLNPKIEIQDWSLIDYKEAWEKQTLVHRQLVDAKRGGRTMPFHGHFILCEHPTVYTLGKSGSEDHLLLSEEQRVSLGYQYYKINRGGDITHHGPGQLVGYPILDLEYWYRDVHRYVRNLEEVILKTLAKYNVNGIRLVGYTGVWTEGEDGIHRKICAIGVHLSRWVSMHGFALNVNNDLSLFQHIIPCGIQEEKKEITSIKNLTGAEINMDELKQLICVTFGEVFECEIKQSQDE